MNALNVAARLAVLEEKRNNEITKIDAEIAALKNKKPVGRPPIDNSRAVYSDVDSLPLGLWKDVSSRLNNGETIAEIHASHEGKIHSVVIYRVKHPRVRSHILYY